MHKTQVYLLLISSLLSACLSFAKTGRAGIVAPNLISRFEPTDLYDAKEEKFVIDSAFYWQGWTKADTPALQTEVREHHNNGSQIKLAWPGDATRSTAPTFNSNFGIRWIGEKNAAQFSAGPYWKQDKETPADTELKHLYKNNDWLCISITFARKF